MLKDRGYELRIEKSIMSEHNLSYIEELDQTKAKLAKGCIARMVVKQKVEMVINRHRRWLFMLSARECAITKGISKEGPQPLNCRLNN